MRDSKETVSEAESERQQGDCVRGRESEAESERQQRQTEPKTRRLRDTGRQFTSATCTTNRGTHERELDKSHHSSEAREGIGKPVHWQRAVVPSEQLNAHAMCLLAFACQCCS